MVADTGPIRPDELFDESRVAAYLTENVPALADRDLTFAQFHGGHANLTYLVRGGDVEYVLRRPPLGDVAPGAHDMSREHRVLSVLHEAFPQAPRAVHFCADPEIMGKPFFVMERRRGTVIRGRWPEDLDPALRRVVGEGLVDAMAQLHGVDFAGLGLSDLGRPEGFVERQVRGWTDRWHRARIDELPEMDRLAEGLASAIPRPQRASLVHNDFKLDNAMVDGSGAVVAIFDWDMTTVGDPLCDLGSMLAYFDGPDELAVVVPPDRAVLGDELSTGEVIERYATATGLDVSDVDWYRALGSFRVAVIVQQIFVRYVRGQTRDERFAALGAAVKPLAVEGIRRLEV